MSPVALRRLPGSAPSRTSRWPAAIAVIGALVVLVAGLLLGREQAFVDRIAIVNRSPYEMVVDVRGAADPTWLPLAIVDRETTFAVDEVLDQGDRWTFRFMAQGRDAGTVTLRRSQLQTSSWRITVPAAVVARLEAQGAPPST